MKNLFVTLTAMIISLTAMAQVPVGFTYQAAVRNVDGDVITEQEIAMEIKILQGAANGTTIYTETHTAETSAHGIVNLTIGAGTSSDNFVAIDWSAGPYFIATAIDVAGGTNFTDLGTSQLLSVPYAMHAQSAGTVTETDPVFTDWDKSTGITVTESQISDMGTYVETETDPVYGVSVASGVTATDTANWNNKLDSYTETDPVFSSSLASGITAEDTANWNIDHGNYTETQGLSDVINNNNSAGDQIKDVTDPTDAQDAATKAYVDALEARIAELELMNGIGTVTDYEGNEYEMVKIGEQIWMAENLRSTKYADGTPIPRVIEENDWSNLDDNAIARCYYDNDSVANAATVGALYTYAAATKGVISTDSAYSDVQGACPDGWHLPSDGEWQELMNYLKSRGHEGSEGTVLKSADKWNGTDLYGFDGYSKGVRGSSSGSFVGPDTYSTYITTTTSETARYFRYDLADDDGGFAKEVPQTTVRRISSNYLLGATIRCVKND